MDGVLRGKGTRITLPGRMLISNSDSEICRANRVGMKRIIGRRELRV